MGSLLNARKIWPRYGQPWTKAEDRKLRALYRQRRRQADGGWSMYAAIGRSLGRTPCSVATRLAILKTCECR